MRGFAHRQRVTGPTAEGEQVAVEAEGQFEQSGLVYRNAYHCLFIVRDGASSADASISTPPPRLPSVHHQEQRRDSIEEPLPLRIVHIYACFGIP